MMNLRSGMSNVTYLDITYRMIGCNGVTHLPSEVIDPLESDRDGRPDATIGEPWDTAQSTVRRACGVRVWQLECEMRPYRFRRSVSVSARCWCKPLYATPCLSRQSRHREP
jgi:hypothetical protein